MGPGRKPGDLFSHNEAHINVEVLDFRTFKIDGIPLFFWAHLSETLCKHAHGITEIFHGCKKVNFQMKNSNIFLIFAQNIDCGYTLEPPH